MLDAFEIGSEIQYQVEYCKSAGAGDSIRKPNEFPWILLLWLLSLLLWFLFFLNNHAVMLLVLLVLQVGTHAVQLDNNETPTTKQQHTLHKRHRTFPCGTVKPVRSQFVLLPAGLRWICSRSGYKIDILKWIKSADGFRDLLHSLAEENFQEISFLSLSLSPSFSCSLSSYNCFLLSFSSDCSLTHAFYEHKTADWL